MSVEVLRSGLWYPRMWLLQQGSSQAADLLHLSDHKNMTIHLAAAGVTGLEALTMPLYRVRTALMVEHKDTVRRNIVQVFRTLYTGTGLRSIPTFLTWDAFLFAQAYAKEHMSDRPISRLAFTTGTQMGMAVIMAPIFVVLINRQKLTNPSHLPFWDALKFHYQHHGLPIFARTAGLGAILLGVQAGLTASAIYLEELL
jgi:hypothetical protein